MSVHKKSLQQLFLYGFTSLNLSALYFEFPIERVKLLEYKFPIFCWKIFLSLLGKPEKKFFFKMARPLRPNPPGPPPLELNCRWNVETSEKNPSPLLMARYLCIELILLARCQIYLKDRVGVKFEMACQPTL